MANYVYTMNRVGKIVPPKRQILKDISLSFFPGAKIGVLGLNGSGKSTLLKIMAGIDTDIQGEARPMPGLNIGYLPQEASIFRRLSVYDNLMAVLQIRDDLTSEQREDRAKELMEEFHIEHLRDSGLGVLITDHNVRETLAVCERAYIVSQGHLIAHGTPQQILEDEQVKRVYLGEDFRL
ncbi:ATP-binding cassette domain-containing protein [Acinetobacter baumannii]|nr:ATP-binding cassette domain-containing protein [Acinetobacter baumannii]